jgi:CubicO group peptidase (beta-lactamase class C family)
MARGEKFVRLGLSSREHQFGLFDLSHTFTAQGLLRFIFGVYCDLVNLLLSSALALGFVALVACVPSARGATSFSAQQSSATRAPDIAPILEAARVKYGLPSIAGVAVRGGSVVGVTAIGERALGRGVAVTLNDAYHLGSMSKSFTATVLGKLVEDGKIRWNATLAEAFPDVQMLPEFKTVTLEMLLTHRAGLSANVEDLSIYAGIAEDGSGDWNAVRQKYLVSALATKPAYTPGQTVAYSNVGYVIASLMAERVAGSNWEDLVRRIVYEPLGMNSCTFGTSFAPLTNPHPHRWDSSIAVPLEPSVLNGNPPVLNGADNVRCSLPDVGKYLLAHLNGERGMDSILKAVTFKELHRARANGGQGIYMAFGWLVLPGGKIWHNGSNTLNYSEMALYPAQNVAVAVATNAPLELNKGVQDAMESIYQALLK